MQKIIHTVLNVGAEKPFRILHITDVHICKANEKDTEEHQRQAARRRNLFRQLGNYPPYYPEEYLEEALRMAKELDALPVVTGDVVDLLTYGNYEEFHRIADGHDIMYTPGGHEHQRRFAYTIEEPDGYWIGARKRLIEAFPEFDMDLSSRVVNGINLVCADNSLDYYNAETSRRLKEELDKGLPVILFSHDPMRTQRLGDPSVWKQPAPISQEDFDTSLETFRRIDTDPRIKAYFTGHSHGEVEKTMQSGSICYETPGLFLGICRLIEIR